MTMYELIQELARYEADTEVRFNACFDLEFEGDENIKFDDYLDYDGVTDKEDILKTIFIDLTY